MSQINKILLFFVLPILGILFYDPAILVNAIPVMSIVVVFLLIIGFLLMKGYSTVLTFAIFLNGMNVIVRLLMIISTAFSEDGVFNTGFTIFTFLGMAISFYLLLRMDKVDVRKTMVR